MSLIANSEMNLQPAASPRQVAERRAVVRPTLEMQFIDLAAWDSIAAGFDGAVQEQLFAYARTRWPAAKPEAVLFSSSGEVVGGALVMIQCLPLRFGAIAVTKWGPIFKDGKRPDAGLVYGAMIDALTAEYAVKRRMMLSVLPRAATDGGNWQYQHLLARRFRQGATPDFPDRYVVNLRLGDAEQRKSFGQKWRYHLNKAEKAGLSFERAEVERAGEFDALYKAMTERKNFADHSAYDTIPALFAQPDPALRPELFFVRHGDEVVAGAIVFKAGDTAVYLFGATNDKALPMRAGYFLHWNIIRWLRDNTRADWYDLGGTDGFQGLHQFKKGMVGDAGVIVPIPPVANYAAYRLPLLLGEGAFAGREFIQQARRRIEEAFTGKAKRGLQAASTAAPEEH